MAKTTKTAKKPMRKGTSKLPAALKAMESMVIATADLDVHLKQMTERLNAAGISADLAPSYLRAASPMAPAGYK
jgi:hypothetical protein